MEFIRRYYYDVLKIEFEPRSGNASDYFDHDAPDGGINARRKLRQFKNGGTTRPQYQDIVVMGPNAFSSVGHIAIVISADDESMTIAQQNVNVQFQQTISLSKESKNGKTNYAVSPRDQKYNVLGWMRK